jgi:hypothetical protein
MLDHFCTLARASRETGLGKSPIFIAIEEGRLSALQVGDGPLMVRVSDVQKLIAESVVPAETITAQRLAKQERIDRKMKHARAARLAKKQSKQSA